ncbi:unnamed protein product [Rhizoctonia solani]|uniref:Peptidase C14 caspase domain-containing protein n=1 Tax=Rhizoctonia solani TaxID=456999 RepID=A0A8H3E181_9AGAM|nr:unnamed protein product [Rhizoctonia solani]
MISTMIENYKPWKREKLVPVPGCYGLFVSQPPDPPLPQSTIDMFNAIELAMKNGDNLPNTMDSLGAKVKRRALLVGVQYDGDRRFFHGYSPLLRSAPSDVLQVYRMLLSRGYEPQNIRILVVGAMKGQFLTHPTKHNILDSLKWLFDSAEPGDYRYFHFSGHGYAYEVEEGQGKIARAKPVTSTLVDQDSSVLIESEEQNPSATKSQDKFYREALLTQWGVPPIDEMPKMQEFNLDPSTKISDEEFNARISKLPKGCVLTMTLSCFHGMQMHNVIFASGGPRYRKPILPMNEQEGDRSASSPFEIRSNTAPRNLFVPPVFRLYSNYEFDPKVIMERVQGPDPLDGVQATVFGWSGYSTSPDHVGAFTSTFTDVVQGLKGNISQREMLQEVSRKVGENTEDKDSQPLIQLWVSNSGEDEREEAWMSAPFVV